MKWPWHGWTRSPRGHPLSELRFQPVRTAVSLYSFWLRWKYSAMFDSCQLRSNHPATRRLVRAESFTRPYSYGIHIVPGTFLVITAIT
jgi:hypothetical protein